jgi:hypothetical protein
MILAAALAAAAVAAPAHAASIPRCHTADLAGHLTNFDAGAGQRFASLVLANTSSHTCTLRGYVGGQLYGAPGKQIATSVVRDPGTIATLTVKAGQKAVTDMRWGAIPSGSATSCPTPKSFHVTPPDETTTLTASWGAGMICESGRIEVRPLRAQKH